MIELTRTEDGVLLPVRAQPNARSSSIRGVQDGGLKVAVTQPAEKGKANKAIVTVLATQLDLRKSQIELVSGPTSSQKKYVVRDITVDELASRINNAIARED